MKKTVGILIVLTLVLSLGYVTFAKKIKCAKNTVEFSDEKDGYLLCYAKKGEVKRWEYGVQFSAKKGGDANGEYRGSIELKDFAGTPEEYITEMYGDEGISGKKKIRTKGGLTGIEFESYSGGGGGYEVLVRNPQEGKLLSFFYAGANKQQKLFVKGMYKTLEFVGE